MTPYRSSVPGGRDGFDRLLLAEWTKLRSVPRWLLTMLAGIVLTVLVALLTVAGSAAQSSDDGGGARGGGGQPGGRGGPPAPTEFRDQGHFVHRPLTGDGTIVARVTAQEDTHEWAKAGIMVRKSTEFGSPYAAVLVTPDHGVRLQSNFTTDVAGPAGHAPRWLKLTRAGKSVTAYQSPDGNRWGRVGTVTLDGLPADVEVGLFVASPQAVKIERQFGGESLTGEITWARASFDNVRVEPVQPQPAAPWRDRDRSEESAGHTRDGDTFTLSGPGDVGVDPFVDDDTRRTLTGVLLGVLAIVALAVLFVTSEYRRGMIHTTFLASPRRGRVLAAKAVVIGAATFVAGLVASFGAFLLAAPMLRHPPSLSDWPVLRAVLGTAALLAVVAVLSLGVATILRRTAPAITAVLLLLLLPQIVATGLPLSAAMWLGRVTPAAGFAIQQTVHRYDTAIGPWAGFGVLCGYTAVALAVAAWRLDRRDA